MATRARRTGSSFPSPISWLPFGLLLTWAPGLAWTVYCPYLDLLPEHLLFMIGAPMVGLFLGVHLMLESSIVHEWQFGAIGSCILCLFYVAPVVLWRAGLRLAYWIWIICGFLSAVMCSWHHGPNLRLLV